MVDDYGKMIKELREKMTLSQMEFAEVLGVSFASKESLRLSSESMR